MAWTVNQLLAPTTLPQPPVKHKAEPYDPNVPTGQPWVEKRKMEANVDGQYRWPSLRGWHMQGLINAPFHIREKMCLFWTNHFGMSDVGDHRAQYEYLQLFRSYATGNVQRLVEEVTVHCSMLSFLNGDWSHKNEPNENYARELFELFTIQKGPQIAPEDYTYYTEDDVRAAARLLTGWRKIGWWSTEVDKLDSYFKPQAHDTDPKQFSRYFNNTVIDNQAKPEDEYKDLIAMIFANERTAFSICRELYRWFVHNDTPLRIERDVIQPMADLLIASNFELEPVLRNLFASAHFYDMSVRGPMIKNPYEFMISISRPLGGHDHLGLDLELYYDLGNSYFWWGNQQQMDLFYPPTVAGWKAYYQAPNYNRAWIGSATLQRRQQFVRDMCWEGIWAKGAPRGVDWFAFIAGLEENQEVNGMIAEITSLFFPRPLHPDQLQALKDELIGGLLDSEWARQYGDYLANPYNPDIVNPLRNKLRNFFRMLFSLAEFHLQ